MINKKTDTHKGDILIVDDDLPSLNTLSSMLTTEGYEVRGAQNGPAALTFIDKDQPELILLDIQMPEMDGYEVCRQVQEKEKCRDIPVLFLSALDEATDKVKGFGVGAVDFITKPFQAEEVLARVDIHIRLSRLNRNFEQQLEERTAALKESEANFRVFMDNIPAVSYMKNESGQHLYGNRTLFDKFDISPDNFIGTTTKDFFPQAEAEKIEAYDEEVRTEGIVVETDDWSDKRQGQLRWWKEIKFPIKLPSGDTLIGGIAFDITERKQREEKMQMMQFSIDHALDRIAWIAPDGRFLYANEAACKEMEYTLDEVLSKSVSDIDPDFPIERWTEHYQGVKKRGYMRLEVQQIAGDGQTHDIDVSANYLKFGNREFMCSFGRDITKRKRAEEALSEQLEFERLIADIATKLAQVEPEHLDAEINETLHSLGRFLRTERAFLAKFSEDGNSLIVTNVWAEEGTSPSSSIFEIDLVAELPWVAQHIRNGKVINAGQDLTGLPDEAKELRKWLQGDGINSGVVVPVRVEGRALGMLGLDTIDQPREYPPSIVDRLRIVADMIGTTLHRIRAGQILEEQLRFEDLISKLSATFIHIKASEIDKNIERGLQLIVEFLDIERGNLFQFSRDQERLTLTHSFAGKGVKHSPRILFSDHQPWFTNKLLRRKSICFSNPAELPKEAKAEKAYLTQQGIKSALIFPLVAADVVHGGITFSSLKRERRWPDKLVQQFEILSEVLSNALLRKRADEKIGEALTEIKQLKDRIEQENIYLREEIEIKHKHEEIIGKSKPVIEMLNHAEQVADTDATVLLLGETGTGKELLARAIHRMSSRKDRPMVKVNCGSLPATLIESELFGREKGAYTGALAKQVGRFEIADGSTIFLDEIGDLPIDLQVKLLRVLQEGQFERLGSSKTISVNSRVIAATNRNLTAALQEGRFREDLFYRLNVFPITVPPLRERQEDIPLLVSAFVREFEAKMAKKIETISQKSINALQGYPWPGNVRELRNVIEQAMIISKGRTLVIREPAVSKPLKHKLYKLDDVERNHILKTLEATGWRIKGKQGTAEILGLKPSTLHFRMKKLGIQRPSFSVNISS